MRRIVVLLLVLASVGVGAFVALRDAPPELPVRQQEVAARADDATALPQSAKADALATHAAERTEETPVDPTPDVDLAAKLEQLGYPDDPATPTGDRIVVEGRVIVEEADGRERNDASGSFEVTHWGKKSGQGAGTIAVTEGRFQLRIPRGMELGINQLEIDGQFAYFADDKGRFPIEEGRPLELRVKRGRPVVLHVIDARSRVELDDVTVVANDDWWSDENPDSRAKVHAEHARSPLELFAKGDHFVRWAPTLFARRAGSAWGSVKVDFKLGGEATIELVSGSTLEVTVVGELPPLPKVPRRGFDREATATMVRLRRAIANEASLDLEQMVEATTKLFAAMSDEQVKALIPGGKRPTEDEIRAELAQEFEERREETVLGPVASEIAADANGTTLLEGVVPGSYVVSLERGHSFDKPQVLAEAPVELVAGVAAHVTLTVKTAPPQRRVPLSGTMHLAPEWNARHVDLHFEPVLVPGATSVEEFEIELQHMRRVEGRPDLWRFDAGEILPGRWLVKSYTFEFQQTIDTGPDGRSDAEIVIGDPADVVVHLLEDATGQPPDVPPEMLWNCKRPAESRSGSLENVEWDATARLGRFRAPAGEIELTIHFATEVAFEPLDPNVFVVRPGANEITIRLRRSMGIGLEFTVDGVTLEDEAFWDLWIPLMATRIEASDGTAVAPSAPRMLESQLLFPVARPGRFTVHLSEIEGFEAVAPFEITVRSGEIAQQKVTLVRKK